MRATLLPIVLLSVAACSDSSPPPPIDAGLAPDLAAARRLLLASQAPIPVVVVPSPAVLGPNPDATVARLASQSTQWAAASFRPSTVPPISGPHLVMHFAGADGTDGGMGCMTGDPAPPMPGDPTRLRAVMCDGAVTVAEAVGVNAGSGRQAAESLVTDTTTRLFPSLGGQANPAGWSYGAPGVSLGGWFGSGGGSGVGIGLGF